MEKSKQNGKPAKDTCCPSFPYSLTRILVLLALLLFVFVSGIAIGAGAGKYHGGRLAKNAFCPAAAGDMFTGQAFMPGAVQPKQALGAKKSGLRIFGAVLRSEENRITIFDNSAKEQIVVSQAKTRIFDKGVETGIAAIKAGQNLIIEGRINKDKQIEAEVINIL